jgi:tight adherence protein B
VRRANRRRASIARSAALDALAALAADLRAGLPPTEARSDSGDRLRRLTNSVWRLAERTGAPAADLVERIEADARAADRSAASAAAQAAGAQATSMLLAALPLAGLGLGVAMGADPFHVLLRTPLGAACGVAAVVLQTAGLLWSERLVGGVNR